MDISILIVSWNVANLLAACLDSILAGSLNTPGAPTVEIIVLDSASADNTVEMLRARYPQVKVLLQPENVGFTRGNNLAMEQAQGRYFMLLNPDTQVVGDAIVTMFRYLEANPHVGIVGPYTVN